MHWQLLGHLLDALDDAEEACVEERLERDEQWRQELAQWRRRLASLEAMRPDFEPPPGLAERTCQLVGRIADSSRNRAKRLSQIVAQPPPAVQNCSEQPRAAVPRIPKLFLDDR